MVAGRASVTSRTIRGVGHAPMLDEPDSRAAVGEFLGKLP
jgi:hypothetical protein